MPVAPHIHPPELPKSLPPSNLPRLENRSEFAVMKFSGCDFSQQEAGDIFFEQIYFRHVIFTQTHLVNIRIMDTRIELSDFSGARWEKLRLRRVEFEECRFLGMQMVEAQLDDVVFTDCILERTFFNSIVCKAVRFENCILRDASLEESDLTGVLFRKCDLSQASVRGSIMVDVDFRTSVINGMQANPKDMRGVIIEPAQAIQMVSLMGVRVFDDEIGRNCR
jgi:uncharacterized protein YjbI with pentapeptide repeats